MAQEKIVVVSNTSPLILLLQINKLDLLRKLFGKILISKEVFNEIKDKSQKKHLLDEIKKGWIKKIFAPKLNVLHNLDSGEASSISLALQFNKSLLIVDDKKARDFALSVGLEIIGTIGVLILAKKLKLISGTKEIFNQLINNKLWISETLYNQIFKLG